MASTNRYTDASDEALMNLVKSEDRDAFIEVMRRYQNRLRSTLSVYCRSAEEVEDYLQETLVKAYTHAEQFKPGASLYPWLKKIALNELRQEIRRMKHRTRVSNEYLRYLQMTQIENDDQLAHIFGDALDRCLDKLPKKQRSLLQARYQDCRSLQQLGKQMELTENAVKMRLYRIREILKKCLEGHTRKEGARV